MSTMSKEAFLSELESLMELPAGTLKPETVLKELAQWDSMQILSYIVLVEEKFCSVLDGAAVAKAKTVDDLAAMLGDLIQ